MMLKNLSKNKIIAEKLDKAMGIYKRAVGLIPLKKIPENYGLWIPYCNSIHSFFMKTEFDAVFVDSKMRVKKCLENVKPNRLLIPVFGARSVIELSAGTVKKQNIEVGDQLHVVD